MAGPEEHTDETIDAGAEAEAEAGGIEKLFGKLGRWADGKVKEGKEVVDVIGQELGREGKEIWKDLEPVRDGAKKRGSEAWQRTLAGIESFVERIGSDPDEEKGTLQKARDFALKIAPGGEIKTFADSRKLYEQALDAGDADLELTAKAKCIIACGNVPISALSIAFPVAMAGKKAGIAAIGLLMRLKTAVEVVGIEDDLMIPKVREAIEKSPYLDTFATTLLKRKIVKDATESGSSESGDDPNLTV